MKSCTAFAPASVANVIVGFDTLGFAIPTPGDRITVTKIQSGVVLKSITGLDNIPMNPEKNTAGKALIAMIEDLDIDGGAEIQIHKGIPLSSGLGGSAASAVAAVVACNELYGLSLSLDELMKYAVIGEAVASGAGHGDNVAASLYGGLTQYIKEGDISRVIRLPIPNIYCLMIHPHLSINTRDARTILDLHVPLEIVTRQQMRLAAFISSLHSGDRQLMSTIMIDDMIEPQRCDMIPHFDLMKNTIRDHVIAFSISGAGPSCFAWCGDKPRAIRAQQLINDLGDKLTFKFDSWVTKIDTRGAHITEVEK